MSDLASAALRGPDDDASTLSSTAPLVLCAGLARTSASSVAAALRQAPLRISWEGSDWHGLEEGLALHEPQAALVSWESLNAAQLSKVAREHPRTGVVVLARGLTRRREQTLRACGAAAALGPTSDPRVLAALVLLAATGMSVSARSGANIDELARDLSPREIEVLGLLEYELRLGQIASVLGVSVDTVKSQTQSIYRKLGVHSRDELRAHLHADAGPLGRSDRLPTQRLADLAFARLQAPRTRRRWLHRPIA